MISGIPFFLLTWDPTKGLTKPQHTSCPLWVKIHNIPLIAFNNEGISRIASALGVPIRMDACTTSMCDKAWGRPGFAKILVDVWAVGELKRELQIVIPSLSGGSDVTVVLRVEYLWEPVQCSTCLVFGHKTSSCSKAVLIKDKGKAPQVDSEGFQKVVKKRWVPKSGQGADGASTLNNIPSSLQNVKTPQENAAGTSNTELYSASRQQVATSGKGVLVGNSVDRQIVRNKESGGTSSSNSAPSYVRFSRGSSDNSFKDSVLNAATSFKARRGVFLNPKPSVPVDPGVFEVSPNAFSLLENLDDTDGTTVDKGGGTNVEQQVACWNIRGLNATVKQREVKDMLATNGISLCALEINRQFYKALKNQRNNNQGQKPNRPEEKQKWSKTTTTQQSPKRS
ncbi:hypothetical protein OSB04_006917 [Centaurea solstitialis]|uniref:DUF4283 domain-containing protein n=1 Tax=Centaurea solstitialis TaxID=347529 RepID=A0AA38WHY9_9ASTR|nr:hypothetical protein OSB04_006917 [Centaurea solstitialis]